MRAEAETELDALVVFETDEEDDIDDVPVVVFDVVTDPVEVPDTRNDTELTRETDTDAVLD